MTNPHAQTGSGGANEPAPATTAKLGAHALQPVFAAMHALRVQLILAIACGAVFGSQQQVLEIYRSIAQDTVFRVDLLDRVRELGFAFTGLMAVSLSLWISARSVVRSGRAGTAASVRTWLTVISVLVCVLPMMAAAIGVYSSRTPALDAKAKDAVVAAFRQERDLNEATPPVVLEVVTEAITNVFDTSELLLMGSLGLLLAALVLGASVAVVEWLFPAVAFARPEKPKIGISWAFMAFAVVVGVLWLSPVAVPQLIGPIGLVGSFFVLLVWMSRDVRSLGARLGVPLLSIILSLAFVFSLLNANDNHRIARAPAPAPTVAGPPPTLEEQFLAWYKARTDRQRYAEKNSAYPIYVVAAPGGGAYAAFHAASTLGALQDTCPLFAHHTFAVSGVSGGSVGSSVFVSALGLSSMRAMAAVAPSACTDSDWRPADRWGGPSLVDVGDRALSKDLLSPLVAGLLFPNFLQAFLPVSVPALDRSVFLERALEQAVEESLRHAETKGGGSPPLANLLTRPYVDHWSPQGSSPALIFNTTEVDTGERRLISPFVFGESKGLRFLPIWSADTREADAPLDIALSTAAVLSARFPWITPAGTFTPNERAGQKPTAVRLVDGAFFENSGVSTALDVIEGMTAAARKHGLADTIKIHLIVLNRDFELTSGSAGLREAIDPLRALLNASSARGPTTISSAYDTLSRLDRERPGVLMSKINLEDLGYRAPLGWRLSTISLYLIRAQNGQRGKCQGEVPAGSSRSAFNAACVFDKIARELEGE